MAPALKLRAELENRIRAHAVQTYPHECCGALLGLDRAEGREVSELVLLTNRREDKPRNRFSITAEDVRQAEKAAGEKSLELIGWYHSHPDSPAQPSEYDREHAWPWYSYIIVRSEAGTTCEMTSWRLADDRASFAPETIQNGASAEAPR
jgi:proteasome lid subunit RPN8/RPN11